MNSKYQNKVNSKKLLPKEKNLEWTSIYFIGIGGIGMSAIAHYYMAMGKNVAGYDKNCTQLTKNLEELGAEIHYKDEVKNIGKVFLDPEKTLVVYTPAITKNHKEYKYFLENNFTILKRSELLGLITKNTFCLAVAGTHGKTTTSSILGHIMQPYLATSFLGGIAENYNSNLILGKDKITVIEADEFDRSFLQLSPNIACITSMDADHLDIYGKAKDVEISFLGFSKKVTDTLIVAKGLPLEGLTYAIDEEADYMAFNLKIESGNYVFDVQTPSDKIEHIEFNLPGKHNIMNALAALAMANEYGISLEKIKQRLSTFKGVKRRFSYKIKTENFILIDDYAHHPTEINAVENAVREMYPSKEILAVFQPHLYSRTRDFADEFALSLSKFDAVMLLDIYGARELPMKGVTAGWLLEKINLKHKKLVPKKELIKEIEKSSAKIVVMMGAGDIGEEVTKVEDYFQKKIKICNLKKC